jgi:hypothetical protein
VAIAIEDDAQWRTLADELGRADLAGLGAPERLACRRCGRSTRVAFCDH